MPSKTLILEMVPYFLVNPLTNHFVNQVLALVIFLKIPINGFGNLLFYILLDNLFNNIPDVYVLSVLLTLKSGVHLVP